MLAARGTEEQSDAQTTPSTCTYVKMLDGNGGCPWQRRVGSFPWPRGGHVGFSAGRGYLASGTARTMATMRPYVRYSGVA